MRRILIVDDEETIVNGLADLLKSVSELDLDVYKSYSGEEAISWLSKTRMDLVITDINMPGMTGLELLDYIRHKWPDCYVILLTGHDDFSYIYQTIQHAKATYILKTESPDKVIDTVKSMLRKLENEVEIELLVQQAKEQLEKAQALFQNDYLLSLLKDDRILADPAQFQQLGIYLDAAADVNLIVGSIAGYFVMHDYTENIEKISAMQLLVANQFRPRFKIVSTLDKYHNLIWFLQPRSSFNTAAQADSLPFIKGTLESIQQHAEDKLNLSINFAVPTAPINWASISDKYYSLIDQISSESIDATIELKSRIYVEESVRPVYQQEDSYELEEQAEEIEQFLRKRRAGNLRQQLELGNQEQFMSEVNPLLDMLSQIKSKHSNLAIEAYYQVALVLLSYINRKNLVSKVAFKMSVAKLTRADCFKTWCDAADYLKTMAKTIFELRRVDDDKRNTDMINWLNKYIDEHLSEDLSLVKLADLVYLNPSYLSRLYKQTSNLNLSEYIDQKRIGHAKSLLGKHDLKIHEVAQKAGYDSATSFSRFFRRMTGLSPQEYRDSLKIW